MFTEWEIINMEQHMLCFVSDKSQKYWQTHLVCEGILELLIANVSKNLGWSISSLIFIGGQIWENEENDLTVHVGHV